MNCQKHFLKILMFKLSQYHTECALNCFSEFVVWNKLLGCLFSCYWGLVCPYLVVSNNNTYEMVIIPHLLQNKPFMGFS